MAPADDTALGLPTWMRVVWAVLVLVALVVIIWIVMQIIPHDKQTGSSAGLMCPRPQPAIGFQPQFNAQEQEIRRLRRQAFQGDFFAQLDLARRYTRGDARAKSLDDPVEAAVWYELALSNPDGYAPIIAGSDAKGGKRGGSGAKLKDCRAAERDGAYAVLDKLLDRMSSDERQEVRDRVIYVLSTQGASGFRTLARLHDSGFGPFGDPKDGSPVAAKDLAKVKPPAAATLFTRNDVDVYLYNYLAAQAVTLFRMGHLDEAIALFEGPPRRTSHPKFVALMKCVETWLREQKALREGSPPSP